MSNSNQAASVHPKACAEMELLILDGSYGEVQYWTVTVACESTMASSSQHTKTFAKCEAKEAFDWMREKIKEVESNMDFLVFQPY